MPERIHVVSVGRNFGRWIDRMLASLRAQTWDRFSCSIVDDASSDDTWSRLQEAIASDPRFAARRNERRLWAALSRQRAIASLASPADHEIVVLLDADDWLLADDALERIHAAHHQRGLLVTHGRWRDERGRETPRRQGYPARVRIAAAYRCWPWIATHPRAFRYGLWRWVEDADLRDARERPLRAATDLALLLPMMELAGARVGFIPEPLYGYNRENPEGWERTDPAESSRGAREVFAKPARRPLPSDEVARLLGPGSASGRVE